MPIDTSWVDPELFLEHNDVTVYHTYKNDDINSGRRVYSYTLSELCSEDACSDDRCDGVCVRVFDVRELSQFGDHLDIGDADQRHAAVIRAAIEAGALTVNGVVNVSEEE